jgi:hypothetical protein
MNNISAATAITGPPCELVKALGQDIYIHSKDYEKFKSFGLNESEFIFCAPFANEIRIPAKHLMRHCYWKDVYYPTPMSCLYFMPDIAVVFVPHGNTIAVHKIPPLNTPIRCDSVRVECLSALYPTSWKQFMAPTEDDTQSMRNHILELLKEAGIEYL